MKSKWCICLLLLCGTAHAERVVMGPNAQNDRLVVYSWLDGEGNRHFTDDQRKAPKSATKRVVNTPRPAYTPVYSSVGDNSVANPSDNPTPPPTSMPPSALPPLPPPFAAPQGIKP